MAAVLGSVMPGVISAQTAEESQSDRRLLLFYKNMGHATVTEFRRQIRPLLDEHQRVIEADVEYEVTTSLSATAFASREHGGRQIEINGGWLLLLDQMTMAGVANSWGATECSHQFLYDLFNGIRANTNPARRGPLMRGGDVFQFAARHRALCPNVSLARFQDDATAQRLRQVLTGASMFWLLAHELGHQVYNHQLGNGTDEQRLDRSRQNETEADMFALQMMTRNGLDPPMALPAFLILVGLNGYSVEVEQRSTHPSGLRRFEVMLDSLKTLADRDPDFKRGLQRGDRVEQWQQYLRRLNDAIEEGLSGK